jgi:predicted helicase
LEIRWFADTKFEEIPFDHITSDRKANWINLTDNDFDTFLPLIDKDVKAGKSETAIFQLFSSGVKTQRDEWVYDFSKEALIERMKYFVEVYQDRLENCVKRELDIKWDRELEKYLSRGISKEYDPACVMLSAYRAFTKKYFYFDKHFNGMIYQIPALFPKLNISNPIIAVTNHTQIPFLVQAVDCIPEVAVGGVLVNASPSTATTKTGIASTTLPTGAWNSFADIISPHPPNPPLPGERGESVVVGSPIYLQQISPLLVGERVRVKTYPYW